MCGRTLVIHPHAVAEWFEIQEPPEAFLVPRYNIAPSQTLPVIRTLHRLELLRWGIARPRLTPAINRRAERLGPSSRRQRRCLVAVEGFYEWKKNGRTSQPFLFRDIDGHPMALGAVWASAPRADGGVVESVAVLTCPAHRPVEAIHSRMPLVIPRDAYARWLDPSANVSDLLSPGNSRLSAVAVSAHVNSPMNDDPGCIAPALKRQMELF